MTLNKLNTDLNSLKTHLWKSGREKVLGLQNRNKTTQMIRKTTPDNLQELKY